ncbi:MAG: DMT family transporter [Bdellovibrionota bacterium]
MGFVFLPTIEMGVMHNQSFWGMIALLVMSLTYAINVVWTRKWGRKIDLAWVLWIQTLTSSIVLLLLSLLWGESYPSMETIQASPRSVLGILYLAFCSTTLAMLFFYHLVHTWGAVKASSVNYGLPFVAIFVDYLVLKQLPSLFEWIGLVSIMLGLLLLHFYRQRKTKEVR